MTTKITAARIRNSDGRVLDKTGHPLATVDELSAAIAATREAAHIYVLGPTDPDDGLPVGSIIIRTSQ